MIRMVTPKNPLIFPSEENWLGFRARLSFPSGQGTMPASRLQTVFSITHSDHSIPHTGSCAITVLEMLAVMDSALIELRLVSIMGIPSRFREVRLIHGDSRKSRVPFELPKGKLAVMIDVVPKLRTDLEIIPTSYQGQRAFVVKDSMGLINKPILLYGEILEFVGLIDGNRNVRDIQLELMRLRNRMLVSSTEVSQVLTELDDLFLLDSDRFRIERDRIVSDFSTLKVRPAVFAGGAYPDSVDGLQGFLESIFLPGTVAIDKPEGTRVVALVAPHIDLAVGKGVYAKTYGFIRDLSPKNIILLGTGHSVHNHLFSLTEKDYETPFGRVKTDREKVDILRQLDLPIVAADDFAHRSEHSIEFQLIFLQHLFGSEFHALPILCGAFPDSMASSSQPDEDPDVKEFIHSLKLFVDEDPTGTLVVAGVDFSHVGPKFGHGQQASVLLAETEAHDRVLIDSICRGDVHRFWAEVRKSDNRFNVCGFSALACLMELFPDARGECLDYEIWKEAPTQSAVSFAGIALFE